MSKSNRGTAWAFLVVSDPQQADSLPDQDAWARETAAARGWALTRTISGVSSGKLGPRKLALGMIADLESLPADQRPERLMMIRLERLGRGDGLEAMDAFLQIRSLGVTVHTRLDGDVASARASELLMPALRFFIGGMENEVRREKLLSMYARRREARKADPTIAISARAPYGLTYSAGHLVPEQPQAGIVRFAFELKCLGYGYHLIAKRLGDLAPPVLFKNGRSRAQAATPDRVRRFIHNERYRGIIVSDETWVQAQKPVSRYSPKVRHFNYPLGGALRCECGITLVGVRATGFRSGTYRYYQCRNMKAHAGRMKHHRSDRLESAFVELLHRLRIDQELATAYIQAKRLAEDDGRINTQLVALRSEVERFDDRLRSIFSAFENGSVAVHDLQRRLDEQRQRQRIVIHRISDLECEQSELRATTSREADLQELVGSAAANWVNAPIHDQRALAKAVCTAFGGCVVNADGLLTISALVDRS